MRIPWPSYLCESETHTDNKQTSKRFNYNVTSKNNLPL